MLERDPCAQNKQGRDGFSGYHGSLGSEGETSKKAVFSETQVQPLSPPHHPSPAKLQDPLHERHGGNWDGLLTRANSFESPPGALDMIAF